MYTSEIQSTVNNARTVEITGDSNSTFKNVFQKYINSRTHTALLNISRIHIYNKDRWL